MCSLWQIIIFKTHCNKCHNLKSKQILKLVYDKTFSQTSQSTIQMSHFVTEVSLITQEDNISYKQESISDAGGVL